MRLSIARSVLVLAAFASWSLPASLIGIFAKDVLRVGKGTHFDAVPRIVVTMRINSHVQALCEVLHVRCLLVIVELLGIEICFSIDHASLCAKQTCKSDEKGVFIAHHFFLFTILCLLFLCVSVIFF